MKRPLLSRVELKRDPVLLVLHAIIVLCVTFLIYTGRVTWEQILPPSLAAMLVPGLLGLREKPPTPPT